jgi:hypothetical protein
VIGFLQPLALLGLVAVAIPPLLHLLGRRLPPTVMFPAVRYLTATEREHSRRLKLRNLLLLILRMAVILFVVLAAARPVARVASGTGHPATAVALVVDNSLSAGAVVRGRRVLDVLVDRAREVMRRVESGDRLWLVLGDGLPRRVGRAEALETLDSLTPWPVRLDVTEAVRVAARVLRDEALPAREVVLLSDLQASALSAGEAVAVRVLVWRPPEVPDNRGIDSAYVEPVLWAPAGEVVVRLGGSFTEPAALRLATEGRDLAGAVAGAGDVVTLAATVPLRGWLAARVELDPDELRADDSWWLALRIVEPAAVRTVGEVGRFVEDALDVLQEGGRVRRGDEVSLADRPTTGITILFPPADPSLVGAVNRALAVRGVAWRVGEIVQGEWSLTGEVEPASGAAVYRRHRLLGDGAVLVRAAGEPWLVRAGDQVIVASRMEEAWTTLPVRAAFIPFLDVLVNQVAARESWIVRAAPGATARLPAAARAVLLPAGEVTVPSDGRLPAPRAPGVYFLRGPRGDTVGALEVNHDRRESRLETATARSVRATLGDQARLLSDRGMDRELFEGERRADVTGLLLAAAIVAALAELGLASAGGAKRGT